MAELILALDLPDGESALRLVDRIPEARWVKVGSVLATREGTALVRRLVDRGLSVFLDLKWHDIPSTVRGAVEAAKDLGVRMVTVHVLGGMEMLATAAEAAAGTVAVVGVTVLTSHSAGSYGLACGRPDVDLAAEAVRQAKNAIHAGLDGVVTSSHEVGALRLELGVAPLLIVPGIRRAGEPADDQNRTATPRDAVRAGATHLVVGRPILRARDPAVAWAEVRGEMV